MKKISIYTIAALAAFTFFSCNKEVQAPEEDAPVPAKTGATITIKARTAETRTHIIANESGENVTYTAHWDDEGEALGLILTPGAITASDAPAELPGTKVGGEMVFSASGLDYEDGTYNMFVFSPFEAFNSVGDGYIIAELKGAQNPINGSFDPKADLLGYATDGVVIADGQATIENIELMRPMAILRVNLLTADNSDPAFGETVSDFSMELPSLLPLTGKIKITSTGGVEFTEPESSVIAHIANTEEITVGAAGDDKAVYLIVAPITIPQDTPITFTVSTESFNGENALTYTFPAKVNMELEAGKVNTIDLIISGESAEARYAGGTGIEGDPWLIATPQHMLNMVEDLVADQIKYFKMIDDVDLDGITWVPMNYDNNFKKGVYFDGDNHTISNLKSYGTGQGPDGEGQGYPSFAGVLNGTIKNVTFDGVSILAGNQKAGAVGGYIGTTGIVGTCEGVTVKNVTISGTNYIGGFCGQVGNAGDTFTNCHVLGATVTQNYATADTERSTGGFAGHASTAAQYTNCTVRATVQQGSGKTINAVGGFIGKADGGIGTFSGCQVLEGSSVTGNKYVGGFVGYNNKNSTYNNCSSAADVTSTGEDVGGFVGYTYTGNYGPSDPCVASGTVIASGTTSFYAGGFVGFSNTASYKGCSYQGTSVTSNASEDGKSSCLGGFCGRTAGVSGESIVDCFVFNSASGTTIQSKLQRAGGFIGQGGASSTSNEGTINGCYVKNVTLLPAGKNNGGFVGVAYVPCTNCYVEGGSIKAADTSTGGFAGHVEKVPITGCHSTMSVDCNGKADVGGLIGFLASAVTISKCYYSGDITANGQATGGLIGRKAANQNAIIENCYTAGSLSTTSQVQIHGGIIGEMLAGGTVRNCYSIMTINGGRVLGGIIGRAAGGGWNYETATNNTISKCIAFNPSISATQTGTYGSSGAIIGVTSIKNVMEKCYRLSTMSFVNSNQWGNTMVDQVDSDGTNWTRSTTTGTGDGNQCAYFGKAAASDATVSSLAQTLGWSADIWDFTGDLPTLK